MTPFHARILASDTSFFDGSCEFMTVRCAVWVMGFVAHRDLHAGAALRSSDLYEPADEPLRTAAVASGLVKIEDGEVLLLVDTAERPEDIDANRARRAADAAKEELLQKHSIQEYGRAQANLARAISRLRVKERWHGSN